jgi:hypothetical protein
MTSVNSFVAQRVTPSFTVTSTAAPALVTLAQVYAWYDRNKANVSKLGNTYVMSAANFTASSAAILNDLTFNGSTFNVVGTTLKDFGEVIRIGTPTAADLIVLRRVQIPGLAENNGSPANGSYTAVGDATGTGYVVVQNNSDVAGASSKFLVYVART